MTPRPSTAIRHLSSCLLVLLLGGCHIEQVQIGQVFIIDTQAAGACPGLEWQFVVDAHRAIDGIITVDGKPLAKITGTLNPDDTFRMNLAASEGSGIATVNGAITSQGATFAIDGDAAGAGCNGQTFTLRGRQLFQGNRYGGGNG